MIKAWLRPYFDRFRERFLLGVAREEQLHQLYDRLYDLIAGQMQIQSALSGGPVLKPMRHWALSPDAMAILLADLQERHAPHVVEFGAGQSTVILASWLKHHGGKLTSVEHDADYAATIQRQLEACGVAGQVEMRVLPLVDRPADGDIGACRSYALPAGREPIDLALIDGPPYWAGEGTRYHPLKWACERLAPGGAAYLDDASRVPEQRIVRALRMMWPDLVVEELRAEKGLIRLTRSRPVSG
jgi:predicted O-methyltransferase YrrM